MDNDISSMDSKEYIFGHKLVQTKDAKWLYIENIYEKFHRPNVYDIGGTYIEDVADYWFSFKTEVVGNIFLLHLFFCNTNEGSYCLGTSCSSNIKYDIKNEKAFLPKKFKKYSFKGLKDRSTTYITTYNFSDIDVNSLKNKEFYLPIAFVKENDDFKSINDMPSKHDFRELLIDPVGSDFIIESSDGEKFPVHKLLLSTHSEVFKAMLKDDTAESQNGCVTLGDVCKDDLQCILEFIYSGEIKDLENSNCMNLLILADRFNIEGLRDLIQYALSEMLTIENVVETLVVADMCVAQELKIASLKFMKKYSSSIKSNNIFSEITNIDLMKEVCRYLVDP